MFGLNLKKRPESEIMEAPVEVPKKEPYNDEPFDWSRLAETDLAKAWYDLESASLTESVEDPPEIPNPFPWYQEQAARGNRGAQYALGKMFQRGVLTTSSLFQAAMWYSKASDSGSPFADYELAKMYEYGICMEQDRDTANQLYQKSYQSFLELEDHKPNPAIECKLAEICEKGLAEGADFSAAERWRLLAEKKVEHDHTHKSQQLNTAERSDIPDEKTGKDKVFAHHGALVEVPCEYIIPASKNSYAQHDTPDAIKSLATSIQVNGLIYPLVLNKISDTEYRLIAGEKRYHAITEILHWDKAPAIIHDHLSQQAAQLMLHAANLDVRDYTPAQKLQFYIEENALLEKIKKSGDRTGSSQKAIAEKLNISTHQLRKYKRIAEALPESQLNRVLNGDLSIEAAYKLTRTLAPGIQEDASEASEPGRTSVFTGAPDAPEIPKSGRMSAFTGEPDALETPKHGRTSVFTGESDTPETPKFGRTSAFTGVPDGPETPKLEHTSAFTEQPDASETLKSGRTSAFTDPSTYQEAILLLQSLPLSPGDACIVKDHGKTLSGRVERIEIYKDALRLMVDFEEDGSRQWYPVSEIEKTLFLKI